VVAEEKEPYKRLAEINRAITTSLNFDQVLNLIVENAAELVNAPVSLLLLLNTSGQLRIRASRGIDEEFAKSFSGRMEEDVLRELKRTLDLPAHLMLTTVAVINQQSLTGLLVIARPSQLDEEEQWQLSAVADQAAIALRNARLYEMELREATRERDETMEALHASTQKIHTILESITDLFYALDSEWRFTDVNRQTEIKFQKRRDELLGKVIWEVYPEAINSPLYENFLKAVENLIPVHFELASSIVPGTWFEAHAYPTKTGLTVYLRDITERKEAELTSRLLAAIVESSDDAIISKDLNGIINSWNQGAQRIFGYTEEEAIGQPVSMLIPEDMIDDEPPIVGRVRSDEGIDHYETVRKRKDGQIINVSLTVSPVRDDEGTIIGASKIARDITQQKLAREAISFQASLLGAVEQAVIATDLTGEITYWNGFAERLYGWSASEAVGAHAH
jgi:PAS domain S-box-containing protein